MDSSLLQGQLLALFTALCYATNSLSFQEIGKTSTIAGAAHMRMYLALPMVLIMTWATQGSLILTPLSNQALIILILSGILGYFLTDIMLFQSYVYLGPRESLVLFTISPILIAILGYLLFEEVLNATQITGILTTVGGIIIMILFGEKTNGKAGSHKRLGYILAISAALFQTAANILARSAVIEAGSATTNLIRNIGGLFAFFIYFGLIKRQLKSQAKPFLANRKLLYLLLFATLSGPVLGTASQMHAYTLAPVGIVSTITQVTPIILLPIDYFILKRTVSRASFVGTILSVLGVSLLFLAI